MKSEGETLILKKNPTMIHFDEKMANNSGKGFILTTKFCKSANDVALLNPEKQKLEGKASIHLEETVANNQEKKNKKTRDTKIHANNLHAKLGHHGEDRM